MPRQNFLSKESFVEATEQQAKDGILSIPVFASNIRLLVENKVLQTCKFAYYFQQKQVEYHIDVTILPLDNHYTRISLHGRHSNGESFGNDSDMAIALHDFESAIQAAIRGDVTSYKAHQPKPKTSKKFIQLAATLMASAGIFILKKKLS